MHNSSELNHFFYGTSQQIFLKLISGEEGWDHESGRTETLQGLSLLQEW